MMVVAEDPEEGLDDGVGALGLAVGRGMEGGSEMGGGTDEREEGAPESGGERRSAIRGNVCLKAVVPNDVVEVHPSELGSRETGFAIRDETNHLGESIDEDLNAVEAVGCRELDDAVHGDHRPRACRWGERLKEAEGCASICLVANTKVATGGVCLDERVIRGESERASEEVMGFAGAKVASEPRLVAGADEVEAELVVVRNEDEAAREKEVRRVEREILESLDVVGRARAIRVTEEVNEGSE